MLKVVLSLMVLLGCLSVSSAQSDLVSPTSRCGVYAVEPVEAFPPIQADMSWDLSLTFIAVDSACRVAEISEFVDSLSILSSDSLQMGFMAMMNLRRYYPIWMTHILSLALEYYPSGYRMTYADAYNAIMAEYIKRNVGMSSKEKELFIKDAVFIGKIESISHDYDSVFYPYDGSTICYRVSISSKLIGNRLMQVNEEGAEEIVISVIDYANILLPRTTIGYLFDKAEYEKLEEGETYLFYIDVFPGRREYDVGHYQVFSYPGSFMRIENNTIADVMGRYGAEGEIVSLSDVIQNILTTYNEALGK